jgi:hypothetical protein
VHFWLTIFVFTDGGVFFFDCRPTQACSPTNLGLEHFSNGINSPAWTLLLKGYGHADVIEPPFLSAVTSSGFCAVNPDNTKEDYARLRSYFAGTVTSFVRAVTNPSECSLYRPFLENTTRMLTGMKVDVLRRPVGSDRDVCSIGCTSPLDKK